MKPLKIKLTVLIMMCMLISICHIHINAQDDEISYEDYNGKRIGVLVGPVMEDAAKEFFPDSEYVLLNTYPDCIAALMANKIDAFLADEPEAKMIHSENPEIDYIHHRLTQNDYSFAFRKDDEDSLQLCNELNEFIKQSTINGTMDELSDIWFGNDEDRKVVDMSELNNENRILRVVTTSSDAPYSYIKDNQNVGYDIDLVVRFCKEKGYGLQLLDVDFAGRIPAVISGKCDFSTDMNVTAERMEQVLFSEPTSYGGIVLAVKSGDFNNRDSRLDQLSKVGVITGSIHDKLVESRLPEAQIMYFSTFADLSAALKAKQIDAFVSPSSNAIFMKYEDDSLNIMDEHLLDGGIAFAFNKNEHGTFIRNQLDAYLSEITENGKLDEIREKWFSNDENHDRLHHIARYQWNINNGKQLCTISI